MGLNKNDSYENRYTNNLSNSPPPPPQNSFGSKIFSANITFKECVNLLHYCRLIYKYVILLRESHPHEDGQARYLSGWLMLLMEEIKKKINENGIIYDG